MTSQYHSSDILEKKPSYINRTLTKVKSNSELARFPPATAYTSQYHDDYIELYWYNSRWYDPALGRFAQADTIIPEATQGIQAWDRYAYVNNNPVRFIDPSGHITCGRDGGLGDRCTPENNPFTRQEMEDTLKYEFGSNVLILPSDVFSDPETTNPLENQHLAGLSNPELDALIFFWEKIASPFFDIAEAEYIYRITSHGGYKAIRYSLPTGPIEIVVAVIRQGYRDSWWQTYTPVERGSRIIIVGVETAVTDILAGVAGATGAELGSAFGPVGGAGGYVGGNWLVTAFMDSVWFNLNQDHLSRLGPWP